MLSRAFVPCCPDICLLSHPSSERQGGSQCHPVACPPSLTLPLAASGQSPGLPQGLDCHLPGLGLAGPLCGVSRSRERAGQLRMG